ncbi:hypothetical protein FZEAL_1084 [Fusarium zealandicum]|uniref:Thioesterase n=1 Tax=Fusarium zealandicum TaxID=1053134 RepID=A0A8H4UU61_9HYPO|nr:hypothetical protein FZEAL_1084 [Fusarium zealandicum]
MATIARIPRYFRGPATKALVRPTRCFSTDSTSSTEGLPSKEQSHRQPFQSAYSSRWLSDLLYRMRWLQNRSKVLPARASNDLKELQKQVGSSWINMYAGHQGFLASPNVRGLDRHEVSWGEMDSMGHVNNVVYNRYAESGRVNWLRTFAHTNHSTQRRLWDELMTPKGVGLILRSIRTDYKFPMTYPDRVTVLHRLIHAPSQDANHIWLESIILSERHRRVAAKTFEDIVVYDYNAEKKVPLEGFMVEAFRKVWQRQESCRRDQEKKIEECHTALAELEALLPEENSPSQPWVPRGREGTVEDPAKLASEASQESPVESSSDSPSDTPEQSSAEGSVKDSGESTSEEPTPPSKE